MQVSGQTAWDTEMKIVGPGDLGAQARKALENVVAEIRGRETPEEVVVLGAHLDSWELGTGALDDGCNAALVIDVARALRVEPMLALRCG